jgi:hypothetical protein
LAAFTCSLSVCKRLQTHLASGQEELVKRICPYPDEFTLATILQDSDASNEETDELLSKQFAQLGDALGDAAPAMRSAAVTGVCHLLNTFWELIPAAVTAGFLKRIAGFPSNPICPLSAQGTQTNWLV